MQASRVAGVVVVRAEYANGSVADGNGVVVGTKETVVTTSGFLSGAASISVIEASPDAPTAATLVTVDTVTGIAVLRAPGLQAPPIALARRQVSANDSLVLVTVVAGEQPTSRVVRAPRVEEFSDMSLAHVAATLAPEMNGAPLLNAAGELVAIAFTSVAGGTVSTFGIPVRYAQRLLGGTIALAPTPTERPATPVAPAPSPPSTVSPPRTTPPRQAPPTIAPQLTNRPPDGARPAKTRVTAACERALALNLNGPATTGDVDEACTCVNSAFVVAAPGLREFTDNHIWTRPEGEVINVDAIRITSDADLVPGPVKVVAQRLAWDVTACFGPLPTRAQLTGQAAKSWTSRADDRSSDYRGRLVTPTPGPARLVDRNVGGLLYTRLGYFSNTLYSLIMTGGSGDLDARVSRRTAAQKAIDAFDRSVNNFVVLTCQYRTEARNGYNRWLASREYYYWYAPDVTPRLADALNTMPADHPIHAVQPARNSCPSRRPSE